MTEILLDGEPVARFILAGDTESRRRIFTCRPTTPENEGPCAAQILSTLGSTTPSARK